MPDGGNDAISTRSATASGVELLPEYGKLPVECSQHHANEFPPGLQGVTPPYERSRADSSRADVLPAAMQSAAMNNLSARRRRALRVCLGVLSVVVFAGVTSHIAYAGWDLGRGTLDDFFSDWVFNGTLLVAAAIPVVAAVQVRTARAEKLLIGLAILLWVLGDIYWTVVLKNMESPPYPSLADAGWIAYYIAAYLALVLFVRRRAIRFHRSAWLDGAIATLSVAALASAFVIDPILEGVGGSLSAVATNVAYPLGDLLLVLFVLGAFALNGWRVDRQLLLLGSGFITFAVADSGYLYRIASGIYEEGTVLDSLWLVGLALIAAASLIRTRETSPIRYEGWAVLVAPSLFAVISAGLLAYGNVRSIPGPALVCAIGALLASFLRAGLSFREIRALAEARREALTDELTGLPNRRSLYRQLGQLLDPASPAGSIALVMVDLDGFKELNDTLGHQTGDVVLEMVGVRFREALGGLGTLARIGGDEFAVLLSNEKAAEECARRLLEAIADGFPVQGLNLTVGASIGIALYPTHADDAESLLRRGDIAMYESKRTRRPYVFYASKDDKFTVDRLELMSELHRAIPAGQLTLHYQPKIAIASGAVTGVEALARWRHPERGLIPPSEFIPLAEQAGLMAPRTRWVLRTALRQCSAWLQAGREIAVSANISTTNLMDADFPPLVQQLLEEENVPARLLQLEITESVLMADPARALEVVGRLSELGVSISLDDFGTGYSSLEYLRHLRVDELKIDKSFVMEMAAESSSAVIVQSALQLGRGLGLTVVAEGVEDPEVITELARYGCDAAQGYHFSRPLPPEELDAWLETRTLAPMSAARRLASSTDRVRTEERVIEASSPPSLAHAGPDAERAA